MGRLCCPTAEVLCISESQKGQKQQMPGKAHKADCGVHSFAGSSAAPVKNTSTSVSNHALVYSNIFGTMLITVAETVSAYNYVEHKNLWWLKRARGFLNFYTHWGFSVCACLEGISAELRFCFEKRPTMGEKRSQRGKKNN